MYTTLNHGRIRQEIWDQYDVDMHDSDRYEYINDVTILKELCYYFGDVYPAIERARYCPKVADRILGYTVKRRSGFIRALEVSDQMDIPLHEVLGTLKHLWAEFKDNNLYSFDYNRNIIYNPSVFRERYLSYIAPELYF